MQSPSPRFAWAKHAQMHAQILKGKKTSKIFHSRSTMKQRQPHCVSFPPLGGRSLFPLARSLAFGPVTGCLCCSPRLTSANSVARSSRQPCSCCSMNWQLYQHLGTTPPFSFLPQGGGPDPPLWAEGLVGFGMPNTMHFQSWASREETCSVRKMTEGDVRSLFSRINKQKDVRLKQ